jgi:hypothetical protein
MNTGFIKHAKELTTYGRKAFNIKPSGYLAVINGDRSAIIPPGNSMGSRK